MRRPRVLMIDNYDSFTFNLVQLLEELGAAVDVRLSDRIALADVEILGPDAIVISPGPCTPCEAGVSIPLLRRFAGELPILGICLGHQVIGQAFGGAVVRGRRVMHGKTSMIRHDGRGVLVGLPDPFEAMRYHSLVIDPSSLPPELEVSAWTDTGELMGIRHRSLPIEGVQFHPESIGTPTGKRLLDNFVAGIAHPRCEAAP